MVIAVTIIVGLIIGALLAFGSVGAAIEWVIAEEDFDPGITAWRREWRS